jgi:hypothetical protein
MKQQPNPDIPDVIPAVTLPIADQADQEAAWLQGRLDRWLDEQFIPEAVNGAIARVQLTCGWC